MAFEPAPPRSALTLRLVLASFGLALWIAAAVLAVVFDLPVGWVIAFGARAGGPGDRCPAQAPGKRLNRTGSAAYP